MTNTMKGIKDSAQVLNLLLVIGFLGIVWLMIYGNLSTNLGFEQSTLPFTNQTITLNDSGGTPAGAANRIDASLSSIIVTNTSGAEVVVAGNYTVSGVIFRVVTTQYNASTVNVSYIVSYNGDAEVRSEGVISNVTGGVGTFFGFSNTFFTITAIVLLITILLGLLAIVLVIVKAVGGKKQSFASG